MINLQLSSSNQQNLLVNRVALCCLCTTMISFMSYRRLLSRAINTLTSAKGKLSNTMNALFAVTILNHLIILMLSQKMKSNGSATISKIQRLKKVFSAGTTTFTSRALASGSELSLNVHFVTRMFTCSDQSVG